ncbi:PH domain-containing protein [Geodermatophilus marinus]|uniref:PH domain-containing protein n=1 Tax=Geodermatophilus sp. LHW52908 TaxID=2303986 RepID=UPI000E3E9022|nr:PH domain-containing protein [Geodermatophilus sp. LHW52908]RFU21048.1 PH domain-containing protein [Geodermatophilus sp. LHW52908]
MEWSAPRAQGVLLWVGGLLLGGAALLLDPAGRVLVGAAALLLAALGTRDLLLRPRLSAGPAGVAVRTLGGTERLGRPDVRVRETRRWGVRSRLLELDTARPGHDGRLVLLGRRDLGADPADVARALHDLYR